MPTQRLKLIDLFAGAGGLSLGFMQTSKFDIVAAAENNEYARQTYIRNHKLGKDFIMINNVIGYNFSALKNQFGEIDVVIGGPPCQGFSNSNRQKNYMISKNNSLVKEYLNAIRAIRPRAFVMENVDMLESSSHRFFDSSSDHDFVESLNIPMTIDTVPITNRVFEEIDMLQIARNQGRAYALLLPEKLNNLLFVLYKKRDNSKSLPAFLEKNSKSIISRITAYLNTPHDNLFGDFLNQRLEDIRIGLENSLNIATYQVSLSELVDFQKALVTIKEIYDNEIICTFKMSQNHNWLEGEVNSYSVVDYIHAVLNGDYIQNSTILNATWFGIPQERKRFVFVGIRKDVITDATKDIQLPEEPENLEKISVKDAFFDLMPYEISFEAEEGLGIALEKDDNVSGYAHLLRDSDILYNHIATKTTEKAMERFKAIGEGQNFHNLSDELKDTYSDPKRTQKTIYSRLKSSEPSSTVVNVRKSMWIHPKLDRAVSVREAARLQSFPDSFIFCGTKDAQYQQVGNAVPPMMAKAIAESILIYL